MAKVSDAVRRLRKDAVDNALRAGFPPLGLYVADLHNCVAEAAKTTGIARQTLNTWVSYETRQEQAGKPHFLPDWSLYKQPEMELPDQPDAAPDRSRVLRFQDEISRLKRERDQLARELGHRQDLRSILSDVLAEPIQPISAVLEQRAHDPHAETVLLFLSDFQWGEKIDLANMDGLNSYDAEIAARRLARTFDAAIDLCTVHWTGPAPARIILVLGGDMTSGGIHEELGKTDIGGPFTQAKDCASHLMGNIYRLAEAVGCPIDIIVIPGNHGRNTKKAESKLYAAESYDNLVGEFLALEFRGDDRFTITIPASGDAVFSIYNWTYLATHGDRIGSRGGAGFIGTAGTVARGFKKLRMDYSSRAIHVDVIICGHFHTALQLEEGFCNGSLAGPSEYGRDFRFLPKPATQLFLAVHPKRGITQQRWLQVGDPSEGSIYEPPAYSAIERPRYRVKAIHQETT